MSARLAMTIFRRPMRSSPMPSRISRDILKLVYSFIRLLVTASFSLSLFAVDRLEPIEVAQFRSFAEGIVFDSSGNAYVSHGRVISRISPDGSKTVWAETGAPSGHKILPDGTHLVCDTSRRAVLRLDAQGKILGAAVTEVDGKPLIEPNDLTLDPNGGFYFTDSRGSREELAGEIHYVDRDGKAHVAA